MRQDVLNCFDVKGSLDVTIWFFFVDQKEQDPSTRNNDVELRLEMPMPHKLLKSILPSSMSAKWKSAITKERLRHKQEQNRKNTLGFHIIDTKQPECRLNDAFENYSNTLPPPNEWSAKLWIKHYENCCMKKPNEKLKWTSSGNAWSLLIRWYGNCECRNYFGLPDRNKETGRQTEIHPK